MTPDNTLTQWNADYAAAIERLSHKDLAKAISPQGMYQLTGLQLLQAMSAGSFSHEGIGKTLDFVLVSIKEGETIFQGAPQAKHYNPLGTVHGGWYATLLDSAVGCAIHSMLPAGRLYTTAELSINYLRAATHKTGPLRAYGKIVHLGRQLAMAEGKIVDVEGKLYAHAKTTCLIFDNPST